MPDVLGISQAQAASSKEDETAIQAAREAYLQTLEAEANMFNGFKVTAKDEDVELPITFGATEQEKAALKEKLSAFDVEEYFGERWFDSNGKFKTAQAMEDLMLLENREKILSKIANESLSQFKAEYIKQKKAIDLKFANTSGQPTQSAQANQVETEAVFALMDA